MSIPGPLTYKQKSHNLPEGSYYFTKLDIEDSLVTVNGKVHIYVKGKVNIVRSFVNKEGKPEDLSIQTQKTPGSNDIFTSDSVITGKIYGCNAKLQCTQFNGIMDCENALLWRCSGERTLFGDPFRAPFDCFIKGSVNASRIFSYGSDIRAPGSAPPGGPGSGMTVSSWEEL